eukprot:7319553-Lingulodinium_polyedra.AAC.1
MPGGSSQPQRGVLALAWFCGICGLHRVLDILGVPSGRAGRLAWHGGAGGCHCNHQGGHRKVLRDLPLSPRS